MKPSFYNENINILYTKISLKSIINMLKNKAKSE